MQSVIIHKNPAKLKNNHEICSSLFFRKGTADDYGNHRGSAACGVKGPVFPASPRQNHLFSFRLPAAVQKASKEDGGGGNYPGQEHTAN